MDFSAKLEKLQQHATDTVASAVPRLTSRTSS